MTARCDRTTVCVLDRGHRGPCERPGGVRVVTTSDVEQHSRSGDWGGEPIRDDVRCEKYIGKCPSCGRVRLELYVDGPDDDPNDVPRCVGVRCEKCGAEWLFDPAQADFHGDYSDTDPLNPAPPENNPFGGEDAQPYKFPSCAVPERRFVTPSAVAPVGKPWRFLAFPSPHHSQSERPAADSRWRNRHTREVVTVTGTMEHSPGRGLMYPLVEYVPDDYARPSFADHDPWFAVSEWHEHWEALT